MTDCMELAGYASGGREYRASRQANACEMANMELQRKICSRNDNTASVRPRLVKGFSLLRSCCGSAGKAKFPSAYITSVESDRGQSLTQLGKVNSPALQPRTKQIRKWRQGALANRAHERGRFHTPPPPLSKITPRCCLRIKTRYALKLHTYFPVIVPGLPTGRNISMSRGLRVGCKNLTLVQWT